MTRQTPAAVISVCLALAMTLPAGSLRAAQPGGDAVAGPVAPSATVSSKEYFDHARTVGFPAAGQMKPYILHAEFTSRAASGVVMTGNYTDTWADAKHWRREAVLGQSHFIRSRSGKKWYRAIDGPDATLLQFVLTALEPMPETDDGRMGEWRTRPEAVDGVAATLVWRGMHDEAKVPGPKDFEGFWFDASGQLIKAFVSGMEIRRGDFKDFSGVAVARHIEVAISGKVGMKISVTDVQVAGTIDTKIFTMKGDEWMREYTSEVR